MVTGPPTETAVARPVAAFTETTPLFALLQAPPGVVLLKAVVPPRHRVLPLELLIGLTVTPVGCTRMLLIQAMFAGVLPTPGVSFVPTTPVCQDADWL